MNKTFVLIFVAAILVYGCLEQTPAPTQVPSTAATTPSPTAAANASPTTAVTSPTPTPSAAASPSASTNLPFPSVTPTTPYCILRMGGETTFEGPRSADISAEFFFTNETNATLDCGVNSTTANISVDTNKAFRTCDFPVYTKVQKYVLKATAGGATCNLSITIAPTKPPTIINLKSDVLGATSATVSWTTSRPSTTKLEYGIGGYTKTLNDNQSITDHSTLLSNLTSNSSYQFRVTACDQLGLCRTSPEGNTFKTPES